MEPSSLLGSGTHGKEITVPHSSGGQLVRTDVFSTFVGANDDAGAVPVTIQSSHPRAQRGPLNPIDPPSGSPNLEYPQESDVDDSLLVAWLGVSWRRGSANFYAEMDLGCIAVIHATWLSLQVLTYWNFRPDSTERVPRVTSVSATRGVHGMQNARGGPVWTGYPLSEKTDPELKQGYLMRVPPNACAFRIFSTTGSAFLVAESMMFSPMAGDTRFKASSAIVAMPGQECPLSPGCSMLRVRPQFDGVVVGANALSERFYIQFLLDL